MSATTSPVATFRGNSPVLVEQTSPAENPCGFFAEEAALAVFDRGAARFLAAAAPVRFAVAATVEERQAVFRLRHQVVIARGWADAEAFPDGLERDADDERALHIVGWVGNELVATARIIFPTRDRRLPTEREFDLVAEPRGRVANIDRLAIAPGFSDRRHSVMLGTLGMLWQEIRGRGCVHWASIASAATIRLYRHVGFDPIVLAPARMFWEVERFPFVCDAVASAPGFAARWEREAHADGSRARRAAESSAELGGFTRR